MQINKLFSILTVTRLNAFFNSLHVYIRSIKTRFKSEKPKFLLS